ncbi:Gfo/Idh/MocA family protein [Halobium salinum]|uniref:Gfo/Idh/MocA family protein n=1 Tax=Halobium salinum TaxID=1364940 RepID=A0ABD5PCJ3_9EURY|nr:Gfo/Idh/MocA family oxidoreductase [Halobium salinum]
MTLDIGLVGAGGMMEVHRSNLVDHDANVVGVCSRTEESAAAMAGPHDAPAFTDHERLYDETAPDAVLIAVPPFAHTGQELSAAERGIDFLVEKPLALSREYAREVAAAVGDAGVVTQVGHQFRYADVVERAVDLVEDRTLGLVEGRWVDAVAPLPWWTQKGESGGQLVEQSTHVFDLIRHFVGDVSEVSAYGGQRVVTDDIDFADSSVAAMRHESGAVSQVASTSASPEKDVSLELAGEGCRLELDLAAHTLRGSVDGESVEQQAAETHYADQLGAFLDAVEAGEPSRPRSPYHDALRTFELTLDVDAALDGS